MPISPIIVPPTKEELITVQEDIYSLFKEYYGEERVDVQGLGNNYWFILVHYPEYEITNSIRKKHTIRDLFIKIYFKRELLQNFEVTRCTFTYAEVQSLYLFSHASTRDAPTNINDHKQYINSFKHVCLGEGPIISTKTELGEKYDKAILFLFINQLDAYVQWESLEGGPFVRIKNISLSNNINHEYYYSLFTDNLLTIIKNIDYNRLEYSFNHCSIPYIEVSASSYPILKNMILQIVKDTPLLSSLLCYFKEGKYYKYLNIPTTNLQEVRDISQIKFKGNFFPYTILGEGISRSDNTEQFVPIIYPQLFEDILININRILLIKGLNNDNTNQ